MKNFKPFHKMLFCLLAVYFSCQIQSQAQQKTVLGIIGMEANGTTVSPAQATTLLRMEAEKLNIYSVLDKYDINATLKKQGVRPDSCSGRTCLVEAGKILGADKMMTGAVDKFGEKIIVTLRLIDVKTNMIEKTQIDEYLNLQNSMQEMLRISLQKLLAIAVNNETERSLTLTESRDGKINHPNSSRLVLSGPRIGVCMLQGTAAKRLAAPKEEGGFEAYPYMTIFGYQQEVQYLNEGNYQALFEFIPVISGLDQNIFNPSISILNGFRQKSHGWEFALGPSFSLAPMAEGYYHDNHFVKVNNGDAVPDGAKKVHELYKGGTMNLSSSFIFAIGKSFRSGRMNIPLNFYVVPGKDNWRFGMSFGYTVQKSED